MVISVRNFGETLRELREKRGYTVNQLGIYSEVSPALISKIENGKRGIPKPDTIEKLAKGLKMDYTDLMILAGHIDGDTKESEDEFIEDIDLELTDEEILRKYNLQVDGRPLTPEEAKGFIAFVRAKRSLE